jgi:hypothetical protein
VPVDETAAGRVEPLQGSDWLELIGDVLEVQSVLEFEVLVAVSSVELVPALDLLFVIFAVRAPNVGVDSAQTTISASGTAARRLIGMRFTPSTPSFFVGNDLCRPADVASGRLAGSGGERPGKVVADL